jgi:undecaprenyl-diphosphatase
MRRVGIYVVAGGAFLLAVVLTLAGIGDSSEAIPNWQALVLGLVQGFTELLPISSSGHLILVPWLGGWDYLQTHEDFNQTFDVALHLGTLVAVVLYFRADVVALIRAWLTSVRGRRIQSGDERLAWFVFIATIPAALVGALGEGLILEHLGEPWQIAILLAVFGLLLWVADRTAPGKELGGLGFRDAVVIGLAQSLALAPGVSRSGITITAGRFLGLDRDGAARASFLLLIPTTFVAVVWKGVNDVLLADLPPGSAGPFAVGMLAAAVSASVAIWALLGYVRRHTYSVFVGYRLIVAAIVLLLIASGVRDATF